MIVIPAFMHLIRIGLEWNVVLSFETLGNTYDWPESILGITNTS
jgi:hypothetical protein